MSCFWQNLESQNVSVHPKMHCAVCVWENSIACVVPCVYLLHISAAPFLALLLISSDPACVCNNVYILI